MSEPRVPEALFGNSDALSVWRWQLMLAAGAVLIAVFTALLAPELLQRWYISVGFVGIVGLTLGTFFVPWARLSRQTVIAVPMLDIVLVGLLSLGRDLPASYLWAVPVAWIASYYSFSWQMASLVVVGVMLVGFGVMGSPSVAMALDSITILLALGFIATTIHIGSKRTRAFSRLLRRRSAQLERTVARVEAHDRRNLDVLDSLTTAVAQVGQDGSIRFANDAFRRLYRLDEIGSDHPSPAIEYDGRRGSALPSERQLLARAARGERFEAERVWLFDSGVTWRALSASARPLADGTTVLQVNDVTAVVEAEGSRATLVHTVSHELRNPLTAILGHTDLLLERDDLPDSVQERLEIIDHAGQRMERLVSSVLSEAASEEHTGEPLDFRRLVGESIAAHRPAAKSGQLSLTTRLDGDLQFVGDPFRLRAALDNLVSNAIKYTPRGGSIELVAHGLPDRVEIIVSDTGIGISESELPRVFDAYFRTRRAQETGVPGTGLGMGITREIVSDHGGVLELSSRVGRGTTVKAVLPRQTSCETSGEALEGSES